MQSNDYLSDEIIERLIVAVYHREARLSFVVEHRQHDIIPITHHKKVVLITHTISIIKLNNMIFRKLSLATAVVASATLQSVYADSIFEIADSTDQFSTLGKDFCIMCLL